MKITIENYMTNPTFYQTHIPSNFLKMIEESPSQFTILGARSENEYAGLIISKKYKSTSSMKIKYLAVSDWNKHTGLEEMFFYLLEDIARVEHIRHIQFEYIGDKNDYFYYIDGLLRKNSWTSLHPSTIHYTLLRSQLTTIVRNNKHFRSNNDLEFFEWGLLPTKNQKELLEGEGNWYPKKQSPFAHSEKYEKFSLGVRAGHQVIGWFLIQRVKEHVIHVKSIFLREEFRNAQNSTQLLNMGCIQALKIPNWQYMTISVDEENGHLKTYVDRVFRGAIQNKATLYSSNKKVI
ncbi:N-acetyltransferase domain-containing protein OS=Ureibacillus acetophenoni OX=614649 GN=SAMN05877842_101161 PE=4 SV=1 [Ureibacillus acetophenoni]